MYENVGDEYAAKYANIGAKYAAKYEKEGEDYAKAGEAIGDYYTKLYGELNLQNLMARRPIIVALIWVHWNSI